MNGVWMVSAPLCVYRCSTEFQRVCLASLIFRGVFVCIFVFVSSPLLSCSEHFASLYDGTAPPSGDTNPFPLTEPDSTMYSVIDAALHTPGAAVLSSAVTYPEHFHRHGTPPLGRCFFYICQWTSTMPPVASPRMKATLGDNGPLGRSATLGTCVAVMSLYIDVTAEPERLFIFYLVFFIAAF